MNYMLQYIYIYIYIYIYVDLFILLNHATIISYFLDGFIICWNRSTDILDAKHIIWVPERYSKSSYSEELHWWRKGAAHSEVFYSIWMWASGKSWDIHAIWFGQRSKGVCACQIWNVAAKFKPSSSCCAQFLKRWSIQNFTTGFTLPFIYGFESDLITSRMDVLVWIR